MKKLILIMCFAFLFPTGNFVLFQGKCPNIESRFTPNLPIELYFNLEFRIGIETPNLREFYFLNNLYGVTVNGTDIFLNIFQFCHTQEMHLQKYPSNNRVLTYIKHQRHPALQKDDCPMATELSYGVFVKNYTTLLWVCKHENDSHHDDFVWVFANRIQFNESILNVIKTEMGSLLEENNLKYLSNLYKLEEIHIDYQKFVNGEDDEKMKNYCRDICLVRTTVSYRNTIIIIASILGLAICIAILFIVFKKMYD